MLRVTQQDSSADAKRYYATADYYTEGQEIVGKWGGQAAHMLGLEGRVDKESFDLLCDNRHPQDGKKLTVRTKSERTVGYDFTWSVPKSVSLLYAMTGDEQILDAFRRSVDESMREIEADMQTRVRKGGKDENRKSGNMVWAEFIHTTARPEEGIPDPQLHAHCFVFNSTFDNEEQRWKAGQFRELKADAPYYQAAFRVRLANRLQDLGFGIERKRNDFELAGLPAGTLARFSRRTQHIEQVAAEKGITDPRRKAELGQETREKKNSELSWNQLKEIWNGWLSDKEKAALEAVHRREVPAIRQIGGEREAVDHSLALCSVREEVVGERKLMTEALKRGLGTVTVEGTARELARRPLIRGELRGRATVTFPEKAVAGQELVRFGREGRGKLRPLADPDRPCSREWLNAGQKAAVRHVLGSRDRVTIVRGAAGTGKTSLEAEIGEALHEKGIAVAAIAQSTTAVEALQTEAGFAAPTTVAHFLMDKDMQSAVRGGLVLLDEASQVGTDDMLRLFGIVKEQHARIALVGDRAQHRSVTAGEPLRLLEERSGLPVCQVTEVVRQQHAGYRQVAQDANHGKIAEAFAGLDKLGWIVEIPHAGRYWALAQGYLSAILEKDKKGKQKTALVVSPTHSECDRITRFIRDALKADHKLGDEQVLSTWIPTRLTDPEKKDAANIEPGDMLQFHQNIPGHKSGSRLIAAEGEKLPLQFAERFSVYRPSSLSVAKGDRLRVTCNGLTKDKKHKLSNGRLLTVQGFTPQGDLIVDKGWVIGKEFGHLAYGYAVTSHASQGKTVHKVFIGESSQSFGAVNERSFYVPITRGKEQAVIFTDSKEELLKHIQKPDQPISALEFAEQNAPHLLQRARLYNLLAFKRRLASFVRTHEGRQTDRDRTPVLLRERDYAR